MGILDTVSRMAKTDSSVATAAAAGNAAAARTPSQIWLNVGITIPGAGPDGEDLFVSLPVGLPIDQMTAVKVSGTNQNSIHLKQVKNLLLDEVQKLGASLKPGERTSVPQLSVELYRIGAPEQTGNADNNPLIAALGAALSGSK